jgi:hypothetical protein
LLDNLGGQPDLYVFGEVRVATLALLTLTTLSGRRSSGVVIANRIRRFTPLAEVARTLFRIERRWPGRRRSGGRGMVKDER